MLYEISISALFILHITRISLILIRERSVELNILDDFHKLN